MPSGQPTIPVDSDENVAKIAPRGNQYINETFPIMKAGYWPSITAASGGTQLQSFDCGFVSILNLSGNGDMFVGGIDTDAPHSGRGWLLIGNVERDFRVNNAAALRVCASISGQLICYTGYSNGTNVTIDPSSQGIRPDTAPTTFVGWTPVSGSEHLTSGGNIPTIIATFALNLDPTTVTISSFIVRMAGSATNLSGVVTACGENAIFTPVSGIFAAAVQAPSTSAQFVPIIIGSGNTAIGMKSTDTKFVLNLSGSYRSETTMALSGFTPVSGAADVFSGLGTPQLRVLAQFDRILLSGTVNISSFVLRLAGSSTNLSGTVEVSGSNCTFVLASGVISSTSTFYSPIIFGSGNSFGIQDLAGNFTDTISGSFVTTVGPI